MFSYVPTLRLHLFPSSNLRYHGFETGWTSSYSLPECASEMILWESPGLSWPAGSSLGEGHEFLADWEMDKLMSTVGTQKEKRSGDSELFIQLHIYIYNIYIEVFVYMDLSPFMRLAFCRVIAWWRRWICFGNAMRQTSAQVCHGSTSRNSCARTWGTFTKRVGFSVQKKVRTYQVRQHLPWLTRSDTLL